MGGRKEGRKLAMSGGTDQVSAALHVWLDNRWSVPAVSSENVAWITAPLKSSGLHLDSAAWLFLIFFSFFFFFCLMILA